ncbi:MAG TPA: hypothetical protein VI636_21480 [Candidatus Angelobacter sp.]
MFDPSRKDATNYSVKDGSQVGSWNFRPFHSVLGIYLFALALLDGGASAQTLRLQDHPNHYVILVDRSGSTVGTPARQQTYLQVMHEVLPSLLFEHGFGNSIPRYDPAQDFITVQRFGIFEGETARVREDLKDADFLNQYIHVLQPSAAQFNRSEFESTVAMRGPFYRYTLLSWCKQLALWNLRDATRGRRFNRTFLIVVDDGLTNGADTHDEINEARRWGPQSIDRAEKVVEQITAEYEFRDPGAGPRSSATDDAPHFPMAIGQSGNTIFIEAYEVVPRSAAQWQERARSVQPFSSFDLSWNGWSSPELSLRAKFHDDFASWMQSAAAGPLTMTIADAVNTFQPAEAEAKATLAWPRVCHPPEAMAYVRGSLLQPDPVLGERAFDFAYSYPLKPPDPPECTVFWRIKAGAIAALGAIAIIGLLIFTHFRYRTAPITVRLPGHRARRFKRGGVIRLEADFAPQAGAPACEFGLPSRLARWLVCARAQLRINRVSCDDGKTAGLNWGDGSKELSLSRHRAKRVMAFWTSGTSSSATAELLFRQGSQEVVFVINYS